jgi:hypothetical protein
MCISHPSASDIEIGVLGSVFESDTDPQISTQACVICKDVYFTRETTTSFIYIATVVKRVSLFLTRCNGYFFQQYKSVFIYKITLNCIHSSFLLHFNCHHNLCRWNVLCGYEEFYKFSTLNGKFVFCHFLHFLFLPFFH